MVPPTPQEITLSRLVCDLYVQVQENQAVIRSLQAENDLLRSGHRKPRTTKTS